MEGKKEREPRKEKIREGGSKRRGRRERRERKKRGSIENLATLSFIPQLLLAFTIKIRDQKLINKQL